MFTTESSMYTNDLSSKYKSRWKSLFEYPSVNIAEFSLKFYPDSFREDWTPVLTLVSVILGLIFLFLVIPSSHFPH